MKKLQLTFALLFALAIATQAQVSMNMETWVSQSGPPPYDEPAGWTTANLLSNFLLGGSPISVKKDSPGNGGTGTAARIETVKLNSNPTGGLVKDTAGMMFTGAISFGGSFKVDYGMPWGSKSGSLKYMYKYTPNGADSAVIIVVMTKWNGSKRDTIGIGYGVHGGAVSSYTAGEAMVIYDPTFAGVHPDSTTIYVSSSSLVKPQVGSVLYIDDFSFTAAVDVAVADMDNPEKSVIVYPNPGAEKITFKTSIKDAHEIVVFDISGREVERFEIEDYKTSLNTFKLSSGMYLFNLYDSNKNILNRNKFTITK